MEALHPRTNMGNSHAETQRSSMRATDEHPEFRQRNGIELEKLDKLKMGNVKKKKKFHEN